MSRGTRKKDVRILSSELFIFYDKKLGIGNNSIHSIGCTNKTILNERTNLDYGFLMKVFTRENKFYYEDENMIVLRIFTDEILRGKQSVKRKGKGGMENFAKYILRKGDNY
jgi:hypothetical protein